MIYSYWFLTGHDFLDAGGHNEFEIWDGKSASIFVLASGAEVVLLFAFSALKTFVQYPMDE